MTGEKTVCRRALLCLSAVLFLLCIHPARAYGKTSVPAYLKEGVIVHACGGLNGNTYTNSLEALKETLEKGYDFLIGQFPEYRKNRYLKNGGKKNLYFSHTNRFIYMNSVPLFRLLYVMKILK